MAFEQGGFRGDYSVGLAETYKLLVRNLPQKDATQEAGVYNIIGASAWRYRMASDIWEVKSLLDEALGLRCNACLCCDTSVDELQAMGKAQVNIVLATKAWPLPNTLKKSLARRMFMPFPTATAAP